MRLPLILGETEDKQKDQCKKLAEFWEGHLQFDGYLMNPSTRALVKMTIAVLREAIK